MNTWTGQTWSIFASLSLLLIFAELAAANFKRLAPVLEAWEQNRKSAEITAVPLIWIGGWEKLAVLCWAFGSALPFIVFSLGAIFLIPSKDVAGDLVIGATLGGNIVALSLTFGLILMRGPLSFFRIRTMTSPIFLLMATVAFALTCLDESVTSLEGFVLVLLGIAYAFYFRRFSSEWKSYEKHHARASLLEATEGLMPVIAIFCMGLGFTFLAVLFSAPFIRWVHTGYSPASYSAMAVHMIAPALSLPTIIRAAMQIRTTDTSKALTLTGITHSCLLNTLFLTGGIAVWKTLPVAASIVRVDLAVLLCVTAVFVATLLIEKERGHSLSYALICGFLLYTGLGIFW